MIPRYGLTLCLMSKNVEEKEEHIVIPWIYDM